MRLSLGAIFTKGPGRIYFYRYQLEGRRKTVSLKTANRIEALKQARALIPIIQASTPEIVAAHVEYADLNIARRQRTVAARKPCEAVLRTANFRLTQQIWHDAAARRVRILPSMQDGAKYIGVFL